MSRTAPWGALIVLLVALPLRGVDLDWSLPPPSALDTAIATGKPLILHYVAGPQAAMFVQELDRLWSGWPDWTGRVASLVVPLRVRSWDGSLPPGLPSLPAGGKDSFLGVWLPANDAWAVLWTTVPVVLEFSHSLNALLKLPLADPYQTDLVAYEVADPRSSRHRFDRSGAGPDWLETEDAVTRSWKEEGPLGSLLILKDPASAQKLALPLESDWAFSSSAATQSWSPWFRVTALRR